MKMIEVTQLVDDQSADFVFEVELFDGHKYKVTVSKDYFQKLTGGKIDTDELVKKSFEFLSKRESPDSILPDFNLTAIAQHFPEYESSIQKSFEA